jgi:hypothetical protein
MIVVRTMTFLSMIARAMEHAARDHWLNAVQLEFYFTSDATRNWMMRSGSDTVPPPPLPRLI